MPKGLTRKSFIKTLGATGLAAGLFGGFPTLFKVLNSRNELSVLKFYPISGRKYSRADRGHMEHKVYPNEAAAMKSQPHRGFRARLKKFTISTEEPVSIADFFNGRKDIDFRVASDMKHIQQFGGLKDLS